MTTGLLELPAEFADFLHATILAATAAHGFAGARDSNAADQAAVNAMRRYLNSMPFKTRVAIGEGERDKAPMLFINEVLGGNMWTYDGYASKTRSIISQRKISDCRYSLISKTTNRKGETAIADICTSDRSEGRQNQNIELDTMQMPKYASKNEFKILHSPKCAEFAVADSEEEHSINVAGSLRDISDVKWDIAVDPLECTTLCANNEDGAMSVIAVAERGKMLNCPDVYMKKLAFGHGLLDRDEDIDINISVSEIVKLVRSRHSINPTFKVLNRPRHQQLLRDIAASNANLILIEDGDVAGAILTCLKTKGDIYIGTGGAPEGVIAAAALQSLGGRMYGQLLRDEQRKHLNTRLDFDRVYTEKDMVSGERMCFIATGVTNNDLCAGVKRLDDGCFVLNSMIIWRDKNDCGVMQVIETKLKTYAEDEK